MVDIIVSENCPHCEEQKSIMKDSFWNDEYRIISIDSAEFQTLQEKPLVDVVPFIIIRDENGNVKQANKGRLEAIKIRRIMNSEVVAFNLKTARQAN